MLVSSSTPISTTKSLASPTSAATPFDNAQASPLSKREANVVSTHSLSWSIFRDPEYIAYLDHLTSSSLDHLQHSRIESLQSSLTSLQTSCKTFESSATPILSSRKHIAIVLNQHPKLLDILEIPQLIDTFIRNGYYEEAMELQVHVGRLLLRHPDIPILKTMAQDVHDAMQIMLTQLVSLLRGTSKLPMSIRVIGYLRRMEAFPEPDEIGDVQGVEYMKKYIEVLQASQSSLLMTAESTPHATMSILSSYAVHRVTLFRDELERNLRTLLTQTMYFGASLGRVGVDFRDIVATLFEEAVIRLFLTAVNEGVEAFSTPRTSTSYVVVQPPGKLMAYPALARLVNGAFEVFRSFGEMWRTDWGWTEEGICGIAYGCCGMCDGWCWKIFGDLGVEEEVVRVVDGSGVEVSARVKDVQARARTVLARFLPVVGASARRRSSVALAKENNVAEEKVVVEEGKLEEGEDGKSADVEGDDLLVGDAMEPEKRPITSVEEVAIAVETGVLKEKRA
ncbi:Dor1-like family-domain-containing protein [Chytridium lagenaria]|nr:Dor1-like family-domain-containing protein [Chytridium lagenaria]